MSTRIEFNGEPATAGPCRGCGLILIVTDKAANGDYKTFHQDPMCQWYLDSCSGPLSSYIGDQMATVGENLKVKP